MKSNKHLVQLNLPPGYHCIIVNDTDGFPIFTQMSSHEDSDIDGIITMFRYYLLACGFQPSTVKNALGEEL